MSVRSKGREFAMQMLFQWDMSPAEPARLEKLFWRDAKADPGTQKFANQLFEGAVKEAPELDQLIGKHAENWRLERLAAIDRAILRLAIYELSKTPTPPKVVLNEAIEMAKKFSGEDSAPFINGVLDAVRKAAEKK